MVIGGQAQHVRKAPYYKYKYKYIRVTIGCQK